jgi:hypothetical protein
MTNQANSGGVYAGLLLEEMNDRLHVYRFGHAPGSLASLTSAVRLQVEQQSATIASHAGPTLPPDRAAHSGRCSGHE